MPHVFWLSTVPACAGDTLVTFTRKVMAFSVLHDPPAAIVPWHMQRTITITIVAHVHVCSMHQWYQAHIPCLGHWVVEITYNKTTVEWTYTMHGIGSMLENNK